jgi:hypothetical protein
MAPWIPIFAATNAVYWAIFVYLAVRHRASFVATFLGIVHMLLAALLSVPPFRSFLDPAYPGFAMGLLHLHGRSATLPTALLLSWALVSAWLLVSRTAGKALWIVAFGDLLFALNQVAVLSPSSGDNDIQFGEYLTIRGFQAVVIMAVLLVCGPAISAWFAGVRARRTAT